MPAYPQQFNVFFGNEYNRGEIEIDAEQGYMEGLAQPSIVMMNGVMLAGDKRGGLQQLPSYRSTTPWATDGAYSTWTTNGDTDVVGMFFSHSPSESTRYAYFVTNKNIYLSTYTGFDGGGPTTNTKIIGSNWVGTVDYCAVVPFNGNILFFPRSTSTTDEVIYGLTVGSITAGDTVGESDRVDMATCEAQSVITFTAASVDGGNNNVKGEVVYYVSVVDQSTGAEGALSKASSVVQCGSGSQVTIAIDGTVATYGAQVQGKKLKFYRSYAGRVQPHEVYDLYATMAAAPGDTATLTDTTEDAELGDLPLYHGDAPPKQSLDSAYTGIDDACMYAGRLWALVGNDLFWSDPDSEKSWWTVAHGNVITVAGDDKDRGIRLFPQPDGLYVCKRWHTYKISGRISREFRVDQVETADSRTRSIGVPDHRAACQVPGGFVTVTEGGVWFMANGSYRLISDDVSEFFEGIYDAQSRVGYDDTRRHLWCTVKSRDDDNLDTIIYSFDRQKWIGEFSGGYDHYAGGYDYDDLTEPAFIGVDLSPLSADPATDIQVHWIRDAVSAPNILKGGVVGYATDSAADYAYTGRFWGGSIDSLKRFLYVDIFLSLNHDTPASNKLTVVPVVDGEELAGVTITTSTDKVRRARVFLGMYGQNIAFKLSGFAAAAPSDESPGRVYGMTISYQEFPPDPRGGV